MIDPAHLRKQILRPTLTHLGVWNESWENLLLLTCATESDMGRFLVQKGGPALGIYQMEPSTHDDIWENWLRYKPDMAERILDTCGISRDECRAERLVWDLRYATCMTRCHYLRVRHTIPGPQNWPALAEYYKDHYNTRLGAGTPEKALAACEACGVTA